MNGAANRFVEALRRTQWLRPADLARYQRPLLERMIRHAATQTSFYPERLATLFHGADPAAAPMDGSHWLDVPILRRANVMENVARLKARTVPASAGRTVERHSSGTTGKRLDYLRSAVAGYAGNAVLHRTYEIFGLDLDGLLASIVRDDAGRSNYPHGSTGRGWNVTGSGGRVATLEIRTTAAEQLEWLERTRPDYVTTYANDLWSVAMEARRRGGTTLRFKAFINEGEMLEPPARADIADVFGCKVIDIYGSREFGPLAFECPIGPGYHVCSETVLFELLDESDRPVRPGEQGRVVVTSLYNFAMPLIRYDLADYAVASAAPCPCGRGLPTLQRVAGRARHLFVMPDGSRKWPRLGKLWVPLERMLAYREIQLVQTGVSAMEVKYVPAQGDAPDVGGIEAVLREEFDPALNVTLTPLARIDRGGGGKTEMFVSLVAV